MASKIEDFLNCSVCKEIYNTSTKNPRVLNCGHSLCSVCLNGINSSRTRHCPECRANIPHTSPFPISYTILSLVQNLDIPLNKPEKPETSDDLKLKQIEILELTEVKKDQVLNWEKNIKGTIEKVNNFEIQLIDISRTLKTIDFEYEDTHSIKEKLNSKLKSFSTIEEQLLTLD